MGRKFSLSTPKIPVQETPNPLTPLPYLPPQTSTTPSPRPPPPASLPPPPLQKKKKKKNFKSRPKKPRRPHSRTRAPSDYPPRRGHHRYPPSACRRRYARRRSRARSGRRPRRWLRGRGDRRGLLRRAGGDAPSWWRAGGSISTGRRRGRSRRSGRRGGRVGVLARRWRWIGCEVGAGARAGSGAVAGPRSWLRLCPAPCRHLGRCRFQSAPLLRPGGAGGLPVRRGSGAFPLAAGACIAAGIRPRWRCCSIGVGTGSCVVERRVVLRRG